MAADGTHEVSDLTRLAMLVRDRDVEAEAELAQALLRPLRLMARVRRLPAADGEDLVQETLLTVLRQLREGHPIDDCKLPAYVEGIFTRLWLAQQRKSDHRQELIARHGEALIPPALSTPEQSFERERQAQAVQLAVAALPQSRDRQLLRGHYLERRSKDELCRSFSLSSRQFDRIIYRARVRLIAMLAPLGDGP